MHALAVEPQQPAKHRALGWVPVFPGPINPSRLLHNRPSVNNQENHLARTAQERILAATGKPKWKSELNS